MKIIELLEGEEEKQIRVTRLDTGIDGEHFSLIKIEDLKLEEIPIFNIEGYYCLESILGIMNRILRLIFIIKNNRRDKEGLLSSPDSYHLVAGHINKYF